MICSGVLSSNGTKKIEERYFLVAFFTALNGFKLTLTTDLATLIFTSSPSQFRFKGKRQLEKDSVNMQRPPSQLLSISSKLLDADTGKFNSTQMHLEMLKTSQSINPSCKQSTDQFSHGI